jgi:hypothetical protein
MRFWIPIVALLLPFSDAVGSESSDDFERKFSDVYERSCCGVHAAYDRELGYFFQALPTFKASLDKCLGANPGPQSVKGYFDLAKDGTYQLLLKPQGGFADCLSLALEGHKIPKPPTLPYANPFRFSTEK